MAEILASERVFGLRPARFEERELLVRQKLLDQFDESIDLDWFLQNRINLGRLRHDNLNACAHSSKLSHGGLPGNAPQVAPRYDQYR